MLKCSLIILLYNNIFYNVNSNRKPTKRIVRLHFVETVVLAGSGIGVDHREQDFRKIEHCDAHGQLAHVYKATLAVLHHDIVDIEVAVHATVAVGNEVEKAMQIPSFLFADTRDIGLRCCFLRDETLFRVAAPCGFFFSPAQAVFKLLSLKTAVLSTAAMLSLFFCAVFIRHN